MDLGKKWGEVPVGVGLENRKFLVEVWHHEGAHEVNGREYMDTFSILITTPDGRSCLLMSGENFNTTLVPLPRKPEQDRDP
jgi:hypothetical protein